LVHHHLEVEAPRRLLEPVAREVLVVVGALVHVRGLRDHHDNLLARSEDSVHLLHHRDWLVCVLQYIAPLREASSVGLDDHPEVARNRTVGGRLDEVSAPDV